MVRDKVVTAETAIEVPDGNLFVDVAQAQEVFPLRPEPSPVAPIPSDDEDDADDESLSDKEEKNLWRTVGALVFFISEQKSIFKYGDKPNAKQIAEHVFALLKDKAPLWGLSINSLEKRFAIAFEKLKVRPRGS